MRDVCVSVLCNSTSANAPVGGATEVDLYILGDIYHASLLPMKLIC